MRQAYNKHNFEGYGWHFYSTFFILFFLFLYINEQQKQNKNILASYQTSRAPWPFWIKHLSGDLTHISRCRSEGSHECYLPSDIFLIFRSYQMCPLSIIDLSFDWQHNTCWALACDFFAPSQRIFQVWCGETRLPPTCDALGQGKYAGHVITNSHRVRALKPQYPPIPPKKTCASIMPLHHGYRLLFVE